MEAAQLIQNLEKIQIDLKSLNSKNLDLCLTFGSSFKPYENDFRSQILKELKEEKLT